MNSRYPSFADVTTLKELKFWKKLPKYQQAQIWNFINYRMNDLVMILLDNPESQSPYHKLAKLRAIERIEASHPGDIVYPATIGTGFRPKADQGSREVSLAGATFKVPYGVGCSDLYWAPLFLDEYDALTMRVETRSPRRITSTPVGMTLEEVEKELEERTKK